ncbi:transporter substrate-binding domain-containing protein [Chromohalobacter sp. TMW 2.2308]|uniref:transporter substrate-binding domain-containing protein n=1 Tax=Chromohalobacter TaxID=42054 RepID=UPI001FFC6A49|nr:MULTISPECIES: transporter substrate-binding domain-containing protein [Chromohalobacter]MCK2043228.1 transporter substrate-binding domain-containing protein [Chromohalobacter moromii]MCT8515536.1 transporter substrate-binding domain-containing protein [Chromohalobacter sp. TMW 2.2271]
MLPTTRNAGRTKGPISSHCFPKARFSKTIAATIAGTLMSLSLPALAADLEEIQERGYMEVATEDNYAPFNFIEGGDAKGFNADVLEELRDYADFEIRQEILPWTGLLAAVSNDQYDMALTGASVSDERLRVFNYTPPYASAQHFAIKRADDDSISDVDDLSDKTVGVQAGSVLLSRLPELETMLEDDGGELGEVVQYESYPEAFADLANGRLDYVIDSAVPVNTLVASKPDVFAKGPAVSGAGYVSWPVPKDSPELLEYMTGFLEHLKENGRLAELQEKWFGESFPNLPEKPLKSVEQFHELAGLDD